MMATGPMEITQVKCIFVRLPSDCRGLQSDLELQDDNYAVCEKNSVDPAPSARYFVFKQDGPGRGLLGGGYELLAGRLETCHFFSPRGGLGVPQSGKPVVSDRLVEPPDYCIWILFQKFAQAVAYAKYICSPGTIGPWCMFRCPGYRRIHAGLNHSGWPPR